MSIADRDPHKQPPPPARRDLDPSAGAPQASASAPSAGPTGPALDARALLDHFEPRRRSTVSNWFHYTVRSGVQTPHAVCSAVWATIHRRLDWSSPPENLAFLLHCLEVLRTHQAEALTYAKSIIEYEQIPYNERQKIKSRRALSFVMQGKEPTLPQLAYLRNLGYQGPPPADRAQASVLIDQLRQQQGGGR